MTATNRIDAAAGAEGLTINGEVFAMKLPLERYEHVLGRPSRTIDPGPPAPVGHRNNRVHLFDLQGIYLTEHHASRLIESVNFIFEPADSPFPIASAFRGALKVDQQLIRAGMRELDVQSMQLGRDLPGEYSVKYTKCWVGISTLGRRDWRGKRTKPRYVVCVSVCF